MPLADFKTYEEAASAWQKTPQFSKLTREKRMHSLDVLKDRWTISHAAELEKAGAKPEDLAPQSKDLTGKVADFAAKGLDTFMPGPVAWLGKTLMPTDNTQAAIDLALFAVGPESAAGKAAINALYRVGLKGAMARLAARTAPAIAAGALGGATGGDPASGAAKGGLEALGGEGISWLTGMGRRGLYNTDFDRLRGWLEPRLGIKIPDVAAFRRAFRSGEALTEAEKKYQKMMGKIGSKINVEVSQPVTGYTTTSTGQSAMQFGGMTTPNARGSSRIKMTLEQASHELDELEKLAWTDRGDVATSHVGRAKLDTVHQIEDDIAQQLDQMKFKDRNQWYTEREKVRKARVLKNMMSEPGVIEMRAKDPRTGEMLTNEKVSFEKLQKLVSDAGPNGYKTDLRQAMMPGEQESLSRVLHRGAKEGAEDRPGRGILGPNMGISTHGSVFSRFQRPWPSRHIGEVPFDLGRGRALSALITLGPYQLAQKVNEMTQLPPTEVTPHEETPSPIHMDITKSPEEMKAGG